MSLILSAEKAHKRSANSIRERITDKPFLWTWQPISGSPELDVQIFLFTQENANFLS